MSFCSAAASPVSCSSRGGDGGGGGGGIGISDWDHEGQVLN